MARNLPPTLEPLHPVGMRPGRGTRLMAWLDVFLPEPLHRATPSDLIRYRVLIGSTLVCLLFGVLNLFEGLVAPHTEVTRAPLLIASSTVLGTWLLLRRTASPTAPFVFFCTSLTTTRSPSLKPHRQRGSS